MKEVNSLYIHFPFCKHLCNYCDFYKHKLDDVTQVDRFEKQLEKQWSFLVTLISENGFKLGKLNSIYIGGGTPSLWKSGPEFLKRFFTEKGVSLNSCCEFTIEVDPDTWTEEEINNWMDIGVNRFSIGSQAYTEKFLNLMDRTHSLKDVERTIHYMHNRNLNFSVDLMLGLPNSNERDILAELKKILEFEPPHFSVYILKTRKNYPHNDKLPDDNFIREEYLKVSEFLRSNGFSHYEVSNFGKPGMFSRHNMKYWEYESVAALGPNATGILVDPDKAIRFQWKSVSEGFVTEDLEGESLKIEKIMLGLRTERGLEVESVFPNQTDQLAMKSLYSTWKNAGFLAESASVDRVVLSPLGYLMCDSLIDDIFREIEL